MDVETYRRRLIALEKDLSARAVADGGRARDHVIDSPADSGDMAVADEAASEDFTAAELDATILQQIRDALRRIDDGTYGHCLADGGPIETKRLDAVPWAAYCIRHQRLLEASSRPPSTL
jgi:DnaK suppressor protein